MTKQRNFTQAIKTAKAGGYYTRLTLVYDVHLKWLMDYVSKLDTGKMIECGVARGGCIALCHLANPNMKILGLDSWEPMPDITEKDDEKKCKPWVNTPSSGKMEDVYKTYQKLGASTQNLTLIKGWLEETIPQNKELFEELDILRIDTDFYSSIIFTLRNLYDKVKSGGLIILDDWHFNPKGVRCAVNEFFEERGINPEMCIHKDGAGPAYFYKN